MTTVKNSNRYSTPAGARQPAHRILGGFLIPTCQGHRTSPHTWEKCQQGPSPRHSFGCDQREVLSPTCSRPKFLLNQAGRRAGQRRAGGGGGGGWMDRPLAGQAEATGVNFGKSLGEEKVHPKPTAKRTEDSAVCSGWFLGRRRHRTGKEPSLRGLRFPTQHPRASLLSLGKRRRNRHASSSSSSEK